MWDEMMKHAIHLPLGVLSISSTVSVLVNFEIQRAKSAVHNWMQKTNPEPRSGRDPQTIPLDETDMRAMGKGSAYMQ